MDLNQLQQVINQAIDQAFERHAVKQELPPVLTKKQLMELLNISAPKASELINRKDFPVFRGAGHPRIPTKHLFEWIDQNTEWVQKHSTYLNRVI